MTQANTSLETNDFFQFEADFVESLRCIPMQVRLKLDTCGVKLKLEHWHRFSEADREQLTQLQCSDRDSTVAYTAYVQTLVHRVQGTPASTLAIDPQPPWHNGEVIPEDVQAQAQVLGAEIGLEQWRSLRPLQRFALIKLSRPSHENRNFYPALVEFGLVSL
ncbi:MULTISPECIES: nitrate reductase associated protein [Cyanophyceae]|uniref:nitrate reductase associated protein n=1 Tax=Cyanophyceae TaxID=3028117 RepID=UPI00168278EC|nr:MULTISPECIES: nitrate reductase associated protein [Cyanophyceae]MBD1917776.1 nitrate reductase associated protein [Phormidium sp. FACHB-77]MBD2032894.1 nitrate reductase associated protein [Phormidium sp. FACHB-322]MBD2051642.1 nitrate reductase associated protein [Leptolyngbya sp. FACHB-60]